VLGLDLDYEPVVVTAVLHLFHLGSIGAAELCGDVLHQVRHHKNYPLVAEHKRDQAAVVLPTGEHPVDSLLRRWMQGNVGNWSCDIGMECFLDFGAAGHSIQKLMKIHTFMRDMLDEHEEQKKPEDFFYDCVKPTEQKDQSTGFLPPYKPQHLPTPLKTKCGLMKHYPISICCLRSWSWMRSSS